MNIILVFFGEICFVIGKKMKKFDERIFFLKKIKNHFLSKNYD